MADRLEQFESEHDQLFESRKGKVVELVDAIQKEDEKRIQQLSTEIKGLESQSREMKSEITDMVKEVDPYASSRDTDYVFITFVMDHLPVGLIGLLFAVIFSAAMSSSSSEINALASTSTVDIYKRSLAKSKSDTHYLNASRISTLLWGLLAITFATLATKAENLIQFVNIIGSLFYGTVLGIFLTAFFIKSIKSNAVFISAIITQLIIFYLYFNDVLAFLWFNLVGPLLVIIIGYLIQIIINNYKQTS